MWGILAASISAGLAALVADPQFIGKLLSGQDLDRSVFIAAGIVFFSGAISVLRAYFPAPPPPGE